MASLPPAEALIDNQAHRTPVYRNMLFQGAATVSTYLVGFAMIPLVIKTAGTGIYGSFVLLSSILPLALQIFTLGAGIKCRRLLPNTFTTTGRAQLFLPSASFQLVSCVAACAAVLLAYPVLGALFFKRALPLSGWLVPVIMLSFYLTNLGDDYFRYTHRIGLMSIATIVRSVSYPVLVILLGLGVSQLSVNLLFIAQSLAYLIPGIYIWWRISCEIPVRFRFDTIEQHRWDIQYGFPLVSAVMVENLLAASDRYILAGFLSPAHVGAYAAASAIGTIILVFPKVATSVLTSAMSRATDAGHPQEAQTLLNRTLMLFLVLSFPFIIGSALLAQPILALLANAEVAAMGRWVVPLVAMGSVLYGYTYFIFNTLFVQMNTRLWLRANAAAAVTSIALNAILVPIFRRIEVAAAVTVASYAISVIVIERSHERPWPIRIDKVLLGKSFAAAGVMAAGVWLLRYILGSNMSLATAVAIQISAGVGLYAAILWILGGVSLSDIRQLREAVSR